MLARRANLTTAAAASVAVLLVGYVIYRRRKAGRQGRRWWPPGVEVRPSWNPRIGAPEGLSFDIDARLQADSDRAVIYATAAPGKRPEVRFHFGFSDGSLDITPLLDEGAKATKFEYVKTGLPNGASAKATLQDKTLTLGAEVAVAGGELLPEVTVDLNDVTAAPKLSLKQSFSL